jgi:hypothetical protein
VELIAARLGNHVDDAAGGAPVLGLVAAGLDVDLLDELEVELLALEPVLHARGVDAVDEIRVLRARRAVDGDRVLVGVVLTGVEEPPASPDDAQKLRWWERVDRPRRQVGPERGGAMSTTGTPRRQRGLP